MTTLLAKLKPTLLWLWGWVKWADAKLMAFVTSAVSWAVAHVAAYKNGYFWLVVGGSLASYFFWASIVGAFHWVADPMRQAMAPVRHVSSAPDTLLDSVAVFPSQMPAKLDAPKPVDVVPPLKLVVEPPKAPVAHPVVRAYRPRPVHKSASSPFPG